MLHRLKELALTMLQGTVELSKDGMLLNTCHTEWHINQVRRHYEKTISGCISSSPISGSINSPGGRRFFQHQCGRSADHDLTATRISLPIRAGLWRGCRRT